MQRHQRPNRRPTGIRHPQRTIEQLEPRHALAVNFAAGVWTIGGDDNAALPDDTIVVERNPANPRQLRATVNGVVVDVRSEARMKSIHVVGGAGDDRITIDVPGNGRITTRLEGGFGSDTITGGDGADVILGGPGREHEAFEERLAWNRHLAAAGLTCLGWPVEHGGRGLSVAHRVAFYEE